VPVPVPVPVPDRDGFRIVNSSTNP
jgi:hypothetical protein